jgi:hypothetical protein
LNENGKNALFRGNFQVEKGIFCLFSLKIRTWTTMPLKVGIIATFRGLPTDQSFHGCSSEIKSSKIQKIKAIRLRRIQKIKAMART